MFTIEELTEVVGSIPLNKEIHINVTLLDWFQLQNQTGFGICIIKSDKVTMKLLGDPSRAFKPGFPISVYVSPHYKRLEMNTGLAFCKNTRVEN